MNAAGSSGRTSKSSFAIKRVNAAAESGPQSDSYKRQSESLPQHHTDRGGGRRSQRHSQTDFRRVLRHSLRHGAVNSRPGEQQCSHRKQSEHPHQKAALGGRSLHQFLHRGDVVRGRLWTHGAHARGQRFGQRRRIAGGTNRQDGSAQRAAGGGR